MNSWREGDQGHLVHMGSREYSFLHPLPIEMFDNENSPEPNVAKFLQL